MAGSADAEVFSSEVHAIRIAEQGEVDVVVDHEESAGVPGERAKSPSQCQQVAPSESFVAELEDVDASPKGGGGHGLNVGGVLVGGDDIEVGGDEAG